MNADGSPDRRFVVPAPVPEGLSLPDHLGLRVGVGDVPEHLSDAATPLPWIEVLPDDVVVHLRDHASLRVQHGRDVTVRFAAPMSAGDEQNWPIEGWAVTIASLQQGRLSLHAATVEIGGEIVALAGRRGAGKSTTLMGLRGRGHRLLVDDVTLVDCIEGAVWTRPYLRNVHLLPDSVAALGIDRATLQVLGGARKKLAFRPEAPPAAPVRIDRIVVLQPDPTADRVACETLHGTARLGAVDPHCRRDGLAPALLGHERYFRAVSALAGAVPVQRLTRPRDSWTLDEVLDAVEGGRVGTAGGVDIVEA